MSIRSDVIELQTLQGEMKSLRARIKILREKEKTVMERISAFLKSRDQPGLKFNGTAVVLEQKEKATPKKQKDKDADTLLVLERLGIRNPEEALKEILTARKGETQPIEKLKVAKYKPS
jgi:hypothetical protein